MKRIGLIGSALLLLASIALPGTSTPKLDVANGDPAEGRALFTKLRCDSCHALSNSTRKVPHPLPDLTAQPPDAVASMITERGELAPGMMFDAMAMTSAVSQMTERNLPHLVAYLRNK